MRIADPIIQADAGGKMRIDILTLFPEVFTSPFAASIIHRAREKGLVELNIKNIRDFALDKHMQVDDYPYGGGPGMVMKADVVGAAIDSCRQENSWVVYMTPQGKLLDQDLVQELAQKKNLLILCGHYEGIDDRISDRIDQQVSIGNYILTGGEIPAMVLVDAAVRLIPGVLGDERSPDEESFSNQLLEYPQYTRPRQYLGQEVPEILLSGHHENIRKWRKEQSLLRTLLQRPELLLERSYDEEEKQMLQKILFDREIKKT